MNISFIKPLDQPTGALRLLDELKRAFATTEFTRLQIVVAFAKAGPLLRLADSITAWRAAGKTIDAVFGIDQLGTSKEALEFALSNFNSTRILSAGTGRPYNPTFHPKLYLFTGETRGLAYLGSNNLTVGGTETNFEASTIIDLPLPADASVCVELHDMWQQCATSSASLDQALIDALVVRGLVATEVQLRKTRPASALVGAATEGAEPTLPPLPFPSIALSPPSALPRKALPPLPIPAPGSVVPALVPSATSLGSAASTSLVIQVSPHHNGEVFLSKGAVAQNPQFFGWPFTGSTIPKTAGNPSYPQRDPDPLVNLEAFDRSGSKILAVAGYGLNTVYYSRKSEIRVTFRPDIIAAMPDMSLLVIREAPLGAAYDYDIRVYAPGSSDYVSFLTVCNQTMPSGGKATSRRFGWL